MGRHYQLNIPRNFLKTDIRFQIEATGWPTPRLITVNFQTLQTKWRFKLPERKETRKRSGIRTLLFLLKNTERQKIMEQTHQYSERRGYLTQSGHHSHRRFRKKLSSDMDNLKRFYLPCNICQETSRCWVSPKSGCKPRKREAWGPTQVGGKGDLQEDGEGRQVHHGHPSHGSGVAWGRRVEGYRYHLSCNLTTLKAEGRSSE